MLLGILGLVKRQPRGYAITGLVLGSLAIAAGLISTGLMFGTTARDAAPSLRDQPSASQDAPTPSPSDAPDSDGEPAPPSPAEEDPVATADGSPANPFPQPYRAEGIFGGEKYILTGKVTNGDASAQVSEWNMFNDEPPAGFKYVVAEITMEGLDPDGVEPSLAAFDLYLATSEGNRYKPEFILFGNGMHSLDTGPTLYPGSKFTGYVAYVVPNEASAFLLYDNGNYVSF